MKKVTVYLALLCLLHTSCAQSQSVITTLILIRHAEKDNDGTKDPGLSEEGKSRAEELVSVFGSTKIDAIYSTSFKRTTNTIQHLAELKKIGIDSYNPMQADDMDKILEKHRGGTVVISGHSNTTPWVANYFLGKEQFSDFTDTDYDNILILSIVSKGNAQVTWINYGKPTN